jgi:hypothetical protein
MYNFNTFVLINITILVVPTGNCGRWFIVTQKSFVNSRHSILRTGDRKHAILSAPIRAIIFHQWRRSRLVPQIIGQDDPDNSYQFLNLKPKFSDPQNWFHNIKILLGFLFPEESFGRNCFALFCVVTIITVYGAVDLLDSCMIYIQGFETPNPYTV